MKVKEIREKSDQELRKLLAESREQVRGMKFNVASRQLKKVREVRETRRLIARISTILKERQMPHNIKHKT